MNTKFTPGPWEVSEQEKGDGCEYLNIVSEYGTIVGDEGIWVPPTKGTNSANATLIAAAPELLSALQLALEALQNSEPVRKSESKAHTLAENAASAAITKALGGE